MSSCSVTSDHPYYLRKKQNRNELQTVTTTKKTSRKFHFGKFEMFLYFKIF